LRVALELAKDRHGAKVGYTFPPVRPRSVGETSHHFSSASLVPSTQQRLDLKMEVESVKHIE
jgi:hypothetical protein